MSEITYKEIPLTEWEQFPLPSPKVKPDKYGELVALIEQGKVVVIEVADENDLKGKRIAIGRRARAQGFLAEFRVKENQLAVKKSDSPIPLKKPSHPRGKKTKEA